MTTQNTLYKTCFNHNDVLLECWYDQTLEQSDEFDYYYDRQYVYEALLDCIIYNEAN